MNLGSETNKALANAKPTQEPKEGDGCTMVFWHDRIAATVCMVRREGNEVWVQADKAFPIDGNVANGFQYERDAYGQMVIFTKRTDGRYVRMNDDLRNGVALLIGQRCQFYSDPMRGTV